MRLSSSNAVVDDFSGQNQIIREEAAAIEHSQAWGHCVPRLTPLLQAGVTQNLPNFTATLLGLLHSPNLPPSTDDVGVDKNKATYVLLVARENSLRVTMQTCTVWTEPVGLDVLCLRQVEILAIQLHPGHQTANRQQIGGVQGWGEENKTKNLTHKMEKKIAYVNISTKPNAHSRKLWSWSCWSHAKTGLNIVAQLRSEASPATYKADHIAGIFLTMSWGKGSMDSLKEKMAKSLVSLDRQYLRLPDPSSWALYFLRS